MCFFEAKLLHEFVFYFSHSVGAVPFLVYTLTILVALHSKYCTLHRLLLLILKSSSYINKLLLWFITVFFCSFALSLICLAVPIFVYFAITNVSIALRLWTVFSCFLVSDRPPPLSRMCIRLVYSLFGIE